MVTVRPPSQAGAFYEARFDALKKQIEQCFLHKFGPGHLPTVQLQGPRNIVSLISPHAGYIFSGSTAAKAYFELALDGKPELFIIIGPNHTGFGSGVSIMLEGIWQTPFGDVLIDTEAATEIQASSNYIDIDDVANLYEHSIEVQLPFLQYVYGENVNFVPICMMMQDLEVSQDVGKAVGKAISKRNAVVIASTDLTHYKPQKVAKEKDQLVIDAILELNEKHLQDVVEDNRIGMCGVGPTSAAIVAAKMLGAKKAKLLSYKTSGDITGDFSRVVGYASIVMEK